MPKTLTLYSLTAVAQKSGLSYRHVRRLAANGAIRTRRVEPSRIGDPTFYVSDAELRRFLRSRGRS